MDVVVVIAAEPHRPAGPVRDGELADRQPGDRTECRAGRPAAVRTMAVERVGEIVLDLVGHRPATTLPAELTHPDLPVGTGSGQRTGAGL